MKRVKGAQRGRTARAHILPFSRVIDNYGMDLNVFASKG